MRCPSCGCNLTGKLRKCSNCGKSLPPYDRFEKRSNLLYNEALELARVRNLTGAKDKLERALQYDRNNIEARNLLGLVIYESGEMVEAIVQWVISTNLCPENNRAEDLLKKVQSDANEFREANTAIKKFNIALQMAEKGNEDLAIIQLKKVLGINPHYVRAMVLLALLFMKNRDYDSAKKQLKAALKVDVGNVTARRYLNELKSLSEGNSSGTSNAFRDVNNDILTGTMSKSTHYREDKPNYAAMVTFLLGLAIGLVAAFFFTVSAVKTKLSDEQAAVSRETGARISEYNSKISTLESDKKILDGKINDLEHDLLYEKDKNKTLEEKLEKLEEEIIKKTEEAVNAANAANVAGEKPDKSGASGEEQ